MTASAPFTDEDRRREQDRVDLFVSLAAESYARRYPDRRRVVTAGSAVTRARVDGPGDLLRRLERRAA